MKCNVDNKNLNQCGWLYMVDYPMEIYKIFYEIVKTFMSSGQKEAITLIQMKYSSFFSNQNNIKTITNFALFADLIQKENII